MHPCSSGGGGPMPPSPPWRLIVFLIFLPVIPSPITLDASLHFRIGGAMPPMPPPCTSGCGGAMAPSLPSRRLIVAFIFCFFPHSQNTWLPDPCKGCLRHKVCSNFKNNKIIMHPPPASECHHLSDTNRHHLSDTDRHRLSDTTATSFRKLTATASGRCLFDCHF